MARTGCGDSLEYDALMESRQQVAREHLRSRLVEVRESVAAAGLDVAVVDAAIAAARATE